MECYNTFKENTKVINQGRYLYYMAQFIFINQFLINLFCLTVYYNKKVITLFDPNRTLFSVFNSTQSG